MVRCDVASLYGGVLFFEQGIRRLLPFLFPGLRTLLSTVWTFCSSHSCPATSASCPVASGPQHRTRANVFGYKRRYSFFI